MKTSHFLSVPVFLCLLLFALTATAENSEKVLELERKIQERDKVILELLDRVENLEQRVGIKNLPEKPMEEPVNTPQKTAETDKSPEETSEETPGAIIVDEDAAERALMRSLTLEGGLLLPRAILEIEPGIGYSRKDLSTPYLFTSDNQIGSGKIIRKTDNFTAGLNVRLGLPWDSQLEIGLPYRWSRVETVNEIGFVPMDGTSQRGNALGDLRVGLAKTLFREGFWRPNLVGRITWNSKTGKYSDGEVYLGGGFNEFLVSLTAIKRQDPLAFIGGLSYEYSLEEDEFKPGQTISTNFGSLIALSPETSLRFLLSAAYQNKGQLHGSEIIGSDRTIANFVVGASTLIKPGTLFNLSVAIGLTEDASDFSISLSIPFRSKKRLF